MFLKKDFGFNFKNKLNMVLKPWKSRGPMGGDRELQWHEKYTNYNDVNHT